MPIATINISIRDEMKADVEEIIANQGYGNMSEFFRDLVRDYIKQRQERKREAMLLEGLRTGDFTPLTKADFEAIRKRGMKRLIGKVKG